MGLSWVFETPGICWRGGQGKRHRDSIETPGKELIQDGVTKEILLRAELSPSMLNTQGGPDAIPEARSYDLMAARYRGSTVRVSLARSTATCTRAIGNIGECLAFGRIAGRNAAAEKPWW